MMNILINLLLCLNVTLIFGANILIFMPSPYNSHTIAYKPLFKELALRGHNVTFYTVLPFKENIPNLNQVVVNDVVSAYVQQQILSDFDNLRNWRHILTNWNLGIFSQENLFKEPHIERLMQSTDISFDLILLETFFAHECFVVLGHKFNAPVINIHPFRAEEWISDVLRNPQPLSFIPNYRLPITDHMNFDERTINAIYSLFQHLTGHYYYIPALERILKNNVKYPGAKKLPPLLDLLKNTSLTFLDGNPHILFQSPSIPNFISVGGIHILPNNKLPNDLEKFMNDSAHGVIYLALGSYLRVSTLEPQKLNVIRNVLGRLPQRVLLKWEGDEKMPEQPANVMTSKWFPQIDVLAHPKCRAFITHGGLHSILEAAYFGVPIVGIPLVIDQESNLLLAKSKGFGTLIKFKDLSIELLLSALNEILNNPSYKNNAENLSRLIKDVYMTPLETAVFWVEHVLRHKGAEHLQTAGRHLPWYQYHLLDVIFTAIAAVITIVYLFYKLTKMVFKFIFGHTKRTSRKRKNSRKNKRE